MRRIALLLVPLFLVACDQAPTAVDRADAPSLGAGSSDQFFPFAGSLNVCGELVEFSGYFHPVSKFTEDGNGGAHFKSHINAHGTGIGQASGATWNWNDAINVENNLRSPQETYTYQQAWKLIGKGKAANLVIKSSFHVTVTPNGVVNITVDKYEAVCKPPPDAIWSTSDDGTAIATIDPATGAGTVVGPHGYAQGWAAAFDVDGTLYTLVNGFSGNAVLATVDQATGAATPIGSGVGTSMISLEFDASGTAYGIGYVDGILYQIDKTLGTAAPIGATGISANMDLAFNSAGVLYATVGDMIWTVSTSTGAATLVGTVSGTCPNTIMGIMFGANDVLYATNYYWNACLMTIDLGTMTATTLGQTGLDFPHGGDIRP